MKDKQVGREKGPILQPKIGVSGSVLTVQALPVTIDAKEGLLIQKTNLKLCVNIYSVSFKLSFKLPCHGCHTMPIWNYLWFTLCRAPWIGAMTYIFVYKDAPLSYVWCRIYHDDFHALNPFEDSISTCIMNMLFPTVSYIVDAFRVRPIAENSGLPLHGNQALQPTIPSAVKNSQTLRLKWKYRRITENRTSFGKSGQNLKTWCKSRVGQDQVSVRVSVLCLHATIVASITSICC